MKFRRLISILICLSLILPTGGLLEAFAVDTELDSDVPAEHEHSFGDLYIDEAGALVHACTECEETEQIDVIPLDPEYNGHVDIAAPGDVVWYSFTAGETHKWRFAADSGEEDCNNYVTLYDSSLYGIASDDNSAEHYCFSLEYNLDEGATYYFAVKMYYGDATGSFDVHFNKAHNFNTRVYSAPDSELQWICEQCAEVDPDSVTPVTAAALDTSYKVDISEASAEAWYSFIPEHNATYAFESVEYADCDPKITFYDAELNEFSSNDDGGKDNNFRAEVDLTGGETYLFRAYSNFSAETAGSFSFGFTEFHHWTDFALKDANTVSRTCEDCALEDPYTITTLSDGYRATVTATDTVPVFYKFTAPFTHRYEFYSEALVEESIPVPSAAIYNDAFEEIGSNTWGGDKDQFRLGVDLEEGKTYYFSARSYYAGSAEFGVGFRSVHDYGDPHLNDAGEVVRVCADCGDELDLGATEWNMSAPVTANIDEPGKRVYFIIRPTASHNYIFESAAPELEELDTYATVYRADGSYYASGDSGAENGHFRFTVNFTADADPAYILEARLYSGSAVAGYTISAQTVHSDYTISMGSDGKVVSKCGHCDFTRTEETVNIAEGSAQPVSADYSGKTVYFVFTPSVTHDYAFSSFCDDGAGLDTISYLYNADLEQLYYADSGGSDGHFRLSHKLEAGVKYVFGARMYSSYDTGEFKVILEKTHDSLEIGLVDGVVCKVCPDCDYSVECDTRTAVVDTDYPVDKPAESEFTFFSFNVPVKHKYKISLTNEATSEESVCWYVMSYDPSFERVVNTTHYVSKESPFSQQVTLEPGTHYFGVNTYYSDNADSAVFRIEAVHDYERTIITEPTCTSEGEARYECACGAYYTAKIPMAHRDKDHNGLCDFCGQIFVVQEELAFVIDTTGSMGDDIAAVQEKMGSILNRLDESGYSYRVAIVDYRDFPERTGNSEDYPYRVHMDFSPYYDDILEGINSLTLGYGGDGPETVYSGLVDGLRDLSWNSASAKFAIVMGDAEPLDPEPYTGYTIDTVVAALNGLPTFVGYKAEISSSPKTALVGDAVAAEEGDPIEPVYASQKVSIYSISTNRSEPMPEFAALSEKTGGVAYGGNVEDISGIIDTILETVDTDVHFHTPGEAVRENDVPSAPGAPGGWDEVIYCTDCGAEMARVHHPYPSLDGMTGDVDLDNEVTAGDARLALRASVALEELTDEQRGNADVDNDEEITPADARIILRVVVGLEEFAAAAADSGG